VDICSVDNNNNWFSGAVDLRVGDGKLTKFWTDIWLVGSGGGIFVGVEFSLNGRKIYFGSLNRSLWVSLLQFLQTHGTGGQMVRMGSRSNLVMICYILPSVRLGVVIYCLILYSQMCGNVQPHPKSVHFLGNCYLIEYKPKITCGGAG
jgi:hypothetical protein